MPEPEAVRLAMARRWDELIRLVRGPEGPARASERTGYGSLALHKAAFYRAPVEVVRALLYVNPQGAQATDSGGCLALHWAAWDGASVEVVRALLDAYPQGAQVTDNDGDLALHLAARAEPYSFKKHAMLALAHAGHPPSRRWTPETCAALRRVAADLRIPAVRALVDVHLSRVRTLVLVSRRHGLPSELFPLLAGPVYAHDIFQ